MIRIEKDIPTFGEGCRFYAESMETFEAGDFYVSATTVLSCIQPAKIQNYQKKYSYNAQKKRLKETGAIGTDIHKAIEYDLLDDRESLADFLNTHKEVQKPFEQWEVLREKHGIHAEHSEVTLHSKIFGVAGTVDIIGTFEKEICVMDVKTGFYGVKAGWQQAMYRIMAIEQLGYDDLGLCGLQVKRDGTGASAFKYQHIESVTLAYLSALNIWRMLYWNTLDKMNWKFLHNNPLEKYEEFKNAKN